MRQPAKVLIVDDERIIAMTTRVILESNGYLTEVAYDGDEAIESAKRFQPDFLLTDVVMPRMNGVMAAIEIKKTFPNCRVLLFSGNASTADLLEQAERKGMRFEVLAKPVHPEELLRKIQSIISDNQQPKILVVDDDETQRYAVARAIAQGGYDVIEAASGQQAIEKATGNPALILLDVRLPDLNGIEVLKILKQHESTDGIPVLLLTAYPNEADRQRSIEGGAIDYLARPIEAEDLIGKVNSATRKRTVNG